MDTLVFDTGPLSHFARARWLDILKTVVGDRRAVIPPAVVTELSIGGHNDHRVLAVLDAEWIEHRELYPGTELEAFADFASRLVEGERNVGEAEVLALAATIPAYAVPDDSAAFKIGKQAGVSCKRSLALLCEAIREGLLTLGLVGNVVDDLIATEYRLPFGPGEFAEWAIANELILP